MGQSMKTTTSSMRALLSITCLSLLMVSSCSLLKRPATNKNKIEKAESQEKSVVASQPQKSEAPLSGLPEAEEALASGAYSAALEIYYAFLKKNPDQGKIKSDFLAALDIVKREADALKKKEKYSSALFYYELLVKYGQNLGQEEERLSFRLADLPKEIRGCRVKLQRSEAEKAFQAGQNEQAINLIISGLREYPEEEIFKIYLDQILKEIASSAQRALDSKDWANAGKLYSLLKSSLTKHKTYLSPFPLTLEEIDKSIKNCGQQLTTLGLIEYRKGNLKEAIAIWEKILVFQPENEEIKKAIQTAKAQLEKIKK